MHAYDAHGLPYFISSSGVMQFREICYTVVSYAPYILLQIYTITNLATFRLTISVFFHPGPQPINTTSRYLLDILNINNVDFDNMVSQTYPSELQLNKTNT